jgi:two-component sensor histidine kinase
MRQAWMPPVRWVVGVIAFLAVSSTMQAYRLTELSPKSGEWMHTADVGKLFVLNLAYWTIPALLIPTIVGIARRFRFDAGHRLVALGVHLASATAFAVVRQVGMISVRLLLYPDGIKAPAVSWSVYFQRQLLNDLDWCLMVYAVIVGVSHAVAYYHESQERTIRAAQLETHLAQARLKTLEAELHPHFLFNTLHAISTLVHRDPDAADRTISRLSDLLRVTFDRTGEPTVALKDELEFLKKYLEIEQTRFQDRLSVRVDVAADALDAEVPRLMLQPIVENASKHGIANRQDGGIVRIAAGNGGPTLWMEVRDNGGGLRARKAGAARTGVGLSNTRARLDVMYPGAHRLELTEIGGGVCVRIEIPFRRTAPVADAPSLVA